MPGSCSFATRKKRIDNSGVVMRWNTKRWDCCDDETADLMATTAGRKSGSSLHMQMWTSLLLSLLALSLPRLSLLALPLPVLPLPVLPLPVLPLSVLPPAPCCSISCMLVR